MKEWCGSAVQLVSVGAHPLLLSGSWNLKKADFGTSKELIL